MYKRLFIRSHIRCMRVMRISFNETGEKKYIYMC